MTIAAISDIHGYLPILNKCDVVCICGDIIPLNIQRDIKKSLTWLNTEFKEWVQELPCKKVIMTPGNHDFVFEKSSWVHDDKISVLIDQLYEFEGIKFYGTPWIQNLKNWAFNDDSGKAYNMIPYDVDVLLTHMPPKINDYGRVMDWYAFNYLNDFGSEKLAENVKLKSPKYHIFGHVHTGDHQASKVGDTTYCNVSLKDEDYGIRYKEFEFELTKEDQ